ncbi:MAG: PAS domain-containing protein [Capsulimonadaceae bacterium]
MLTDGKNVQQVMDLLISGGNCMVWSADVTAPTKAVPYFGWDFDQDYVAELPSWFDIDRRPNEGLAASLSRVRLAEDNSRCNRTSQRAMISGSSGYKQTFRVRLRNGEISWIDESVTIRKAAEGRWHIVGLCTSAAERKQLEDRVRVLSEELQTTRMELTSQAEEIRQLLEKLQYFQEHHGSQW